MRQHTGSGAMSPAAGFHTEEEKTMAKLDFNTLNAPVLELTMMDDDKTVIEVCAPEEGLIEELMEIGPELEAIARKGDKRSLEVIYELAARLINHNRSFVTVTSETLRSKYKFNLYRAIAFFNAYFDFVEEIRNAKN